VSAIFISCFLWWWWWFLDLRQKQLSQVQWLSLLAEQFNPGSWLGKILTISVRPWHIPQAESQKIPSMWT